MTLDIIVRPYVSRSTLLLRQKKMFCKNVHIFWFVHKHMTCLVASEQKRNSLVMKWPVNFTYLFWEGHKFLRNLHGRFVVTVKSTVENSQNFLAFSEYMNFAINIRVVRLFKVIKKMKILYNHNGSGWAGWAEWAGWAIARPCCISRVSCLLFATLNAVFQGLPSNHRAYDH